MPKNKSYPTGDGVGPSSIRGEMILDHYMRQMPFYDRVWDAAADLIADVLAYIECERRVHDGEAEVEGEVSRAWTPQMVLDEAQAGLESHIADYRRRQAEMAEAFRRRGGGSN